MPDPAQQLSGFTVFCGLDIGKSEHHARAVDTTGKRLHDKALPHDESALRAVLAVPAGGWPGPPAADAHLRVLCREPDLVRNAPAGPCVVSVAPGNAVPELVVMFDIAV